MPAVKFLAGVRPPPPVLLSGPAITSTVRGSRRMRTSARCRRTTIVDLLEALARLKGKFLLSGYPSDLYDSYALSPQVAEGREGNR